MGNVFKTSSGDTFTLDYCLFDDALNIDISNFGQILSDFGIKDNMLVNVVGDSENCYFIGLITINNELRNICEWHTFDNDDKSVLQDYFKSHFYKEKITSDFSVIEIYTLDSVSDDDDSGGDGTNE